jgi:hypothetical protein
MSMIHDPLFIGGASGDYLRLECAECQERCEFAFLGFDPTVPTARITCPKHGVLWEGKIDGYDIVETHKALKLGSYR